MINCSFCNKQKDDTTHMLSNNKKDIKYICITCVSSFASIIKNCPDSVKLIKLEQR